MWIDQRGSEILSRAEALRLLALASKVGLVGRLALPTDSAPIVHPVNFAFEGGVIVVRIGEGSMADAVSGRLVAFETDGSGPGSGSGVDTAWSVLVRGLATVSEPGIDATAAFSTSAMPLVPHPGATLVTIRPDVVTGRRFRLRPTASVAARTPPANAIR